MNEVLSVVEENMKNAIINLEKRFKNVRTGRANASMLDEVKVLYYGVSNPINQLATISVPEARTLSIKPFDKGSLGAIEKAIVTANLGFNPNNNGESILINIPQLTEERRRELVKQVKSISEDCKVGVRSARQDGNNLVKKSDDFSEDDKKQIMDDIQKLTDKYNLEIEKLLKEKEKELMEV